MGSSFFGLTIAASGLNAAHASINTTANNVSNVNTTGYSKQQVNLVASSAIRSYQKFGSTGTGVTAESVTQMRDLYYDEKYWNNQSSLGLYTKKLYYMEQIQNYFSDGTLSSSTTASTGFSSVYAKMFNALDSLKSSAADLSKRAEFVGKAQELCTYFNSTSIRLSELQTSINDEIKSTVDQVNSISKRIAILNKQINIIEMEGGHANELRDQRAMLVDDLSEIVPVTAEEREVTNSNFPDMKTGATYYTVKINGQMLVDNYEYNSLDCKIREERYNQSDVDGLYDVVWKDSNATFDATASVMSGSLKAMFEVRDGNNNDNLTGRVTSTSSNTMTITNPSITDVNKMNMPEEGVIMVNSTQYKYSGFECTTDKDGNISSYTFVLEKPLTTDERGKISGKQLMVGDSVDYMGIPYYMNQMNEFLRSFTKAFNEIQQQGVDLYDNETGSFFVGKHEVLGTEQQFLESLVEKDEDGNVVGGVEFNNLSDTYYRLTASNVLVAKDIQHDPKKFATTTSIEGGVIDAYDLLDATLKLEKDTELFRGGGGDTFLQCIYADVTVDTQECEIFKDNYKNISNAITNQRMSISGVDEDEEALDLMKFQNAYNLSSKCISVMAEMYDRLILETGV